MSKSDLIDIQVALHHETEKAILVSETGQDARAKWIPKSKVEIERTVSFVQWQGGAKKYPLIKLTLPEWLAHNEGLL